LRPITEAANRQRKIIQDVRDALVRASTTFSKDKIVAYQQAITAEKNQHARWALEIILENALVAEKNQGPMCDDTGIPHLFLEIGPKRTVSGELLYAIQEGIAEGLRFLPGRPMAIMGHDKQRLDQTGGLDPDPGAVAPAPFLIKQVDEDVLRLHILMEGGGPAIRGKVYRVFHQHDVCTVRDEIVRWGTEAVEQLGCTPCTLTIGIGRSHYEAAAMMMEAQVFGSYAVQSELEVSITEGVNASRVGPLGLGGGSSVLATFLKVGPQRASGVRIVCFRPCCCFEPRLESILLEASEH